MTPGTVSSLVSEASCSALRAQPGFRAAVDRAAAESILLFQNLDPAYQWITKDIGRAAICVTALALHLMDNLTVQTLTAACLDGGVSSAGRVQQVVRRCQEIGAMTVEDGAGLWTRRPVRIGEGLVRALRERALADFRATLPLAPGMADIAPLVETDGGFFSYTICVTSVLALRRDIFMLSRPPIDFFLDREAGMLILFDFIASQPEHRERLMQEAPISRYALSRRYGVSRAHINKLLAESGQIDCVGSDRVVFSQTLSDAMERHFGIVFELNRCAAEVLSSGWRYDPLRARR